MDALWYVFYLLITLGVLVTVHELGHYVVARASGVRILRFSVGMGRPLYLWKDSRGTEFVIAAIPLGGYLRMYESGDAATDGPAGAGDKAFDRLSPWWRIAIAVAGPAANFVLAFLVYWFIAVTGVTVFPPLVGAVEPGSAADLAGLRGGQEVVGVDGRETRTWTDVGLGLASRLGDSGEIEVQARWPDSTTSRRHVLAIDDWHRLEEEPDLLGSLGISPMLPAGGGEGLPDSAAERAGFEAWDRVVSAGGAPVAGWSDWVRAVSGSPENPLSVVVARDGGEVDLRLVPDAVEAVDGSMIGFAGMRAPTRTIRSSFLGGIVVGAQETARNTVLTLGLLKKMVAGLVSPKNLSGPIMIAKVAKDSAESGWRSFLAILALLSISLGVINLLPIPILDGGHILFATAEIVARRPVSERVQAIGVRMGLFVVSCMMLLAIYNDVTRFL
ncbi:MAG: RIP metalloprotease RseP [Gammaproteobacteria bacterium]|nr:RIP metalloprotease RseP [Gammaproteobacteria bacterium]